MVCLLLAGVTAAMAQSSASYQLDEMVFNSGGHPFNGTVLASANYQIRFDSLGENIVGLPMSSPSYSIDSGFGTAYLPPGETTGLRFDTRDTLSWDPERSAGSYNLYRDAIAAVSGGEYGQCSQQGLVAATATDSDPVTLGGGFFYLVTVENRLQEEGSKGADSAGTARGGTICP